MNSFPLRNIIGDHCQQMLPGVVMTTERVTTYSEAVSLPSGYFKGNQDVGENELYMEFRMGNINLPSPNIELVT